jgi:hypothetical protein
VIGGVDTGMGTCGWARFDEHARRFVGIGAIATDKADGKQKTDDQGDRIDLVADVLEESLRGCDVIVVERMSFASAASIAPIALCFGVVIGIARSMRPRPRVLTVKPQVWQRAVQPTAGKRVDYDELEREVDAFVRRDPACALMLDLIDPKLRNHALDAGAMALMGAFRLNQCRPVGGRRDAASA